MGGKRAYAHLWHPTRDARCLSPLLAQKWVHDPYKPHPGASHYPTLAVQGVYSSVWREYLSGVPVVNLTGNALSGNFTSIDDFDNVCTPDFAGEEGSKGWCVAAGQSSDLAFLAKTLPYDRLALAGPLLQPPRLGCLAPADVRVLLLQATTTTPPTARRPTPRCACWTCRATCCQGPSARGRRWETT